MKRNQKNRRRLTRVFALVLCGVLFVLTGCQSDAAYQTNDIIMGTFVQQTVYGAKAQEAAKAVSEEISRLEQVFSVRLEGSEVSHINAAISGSTSDGLNPASDGAQQAVPAHDEPGEWIDVSPDVLSVLKTAQTVHDASGGALDITLGNLIDAWGIGTDHANIPKPSEISSGIAHLAGSVLEIDETNSRLRVNVAGVKLDFGAVAKGYAADRAIELYREYGIQDAVIAVGGNAYAIGSRSGKPFKIGIRNPEGDVDSIVGYLNTSGQSVVTSGNYERYFEENGVRYHHILDPKTGYPSNSGLISVTIAGENSALCDALSTAVFVLGREAGLSLLTQFDGYGAVMIDAFKTITVTPNLKDRFVFQEESGAFSYAEN